MAKPTTPANRSYQVEVNEGLDILWDTAKRIVAEILDFNPDVVVCLLHSGAAPAKAARMLWQATQTRPFPPLVKSNLGREKISFYPGGSKRFGNVNFLGMYSDPFQIGHFLAWLVGQSGWQAELKEQIQAQLPLGWVPERIMLVDDWTAEGNTFILAMGLTDIIYPQAEKHFVSGSLSWKRGFERLWLQLYHPLFFERLERSGSGGLGESEKRSLESDLCRLVPGTEDIDPFSFNWRPVTVSSPYIDRLSAYLPAVEWLELPRFVDQVIENHIRERIQEFQRGMLDDDSLIDLKGGNFFRELRLDTLVLRDLWLDEQGVTRRLIIEKYHLSPVQASRLLKSMLRRGLLIQQGRGRGTYYRLPPDAYLPPER